MSLKNLIAVMLLQMVLFCLMISCSKPPPTFNNNFGVDMNDNDSIKNSNTSTLTWLALGDSYTIGQSVNENDRFPTQTISLLNQDNLFFSAPKYIATTGWTTDDLLGAIAQQNPQGPYNVVTLLIGVNDQYQHFDTGSYRINFMQCLQHAIALAGNKKDHVFVLSIPDYSVTSFAAGSDTAQISKEIDEFNAINKAITLSFNISYTDITPLTREIKNDASLIAPDGLHPSAKEYAQWAKLLAPQIARILK